MISARKPWWWYAETRSPKRADDAENEAALRKALDLLLEMGDEAADDIAQTAMELLRCLEWSRAFEAKAELLRQFATFPPQARDELRRAGIEIGGRP